MVDKKQNKKQAWRNQWQMVTLIGHVKPTENLIKTKKQKKKNNKQTNKNKQKASVAQPMANGYAHLTRKTQCHFAKHSITRKKKQETNKKPSRHNQWQMVTHN